MMAALVQRYGSGGTYWPDHPDVPRLPVIDFEVWNEPNFAAFWCPRPQPARYAKLLLELRSGNPRGSIPTLA